MNAPELSQPVPKTVEWSDPQRLCDKPLVSVVMLAYNHDAYLAEAVESVLGQTADFPFELLIGEDCSSDATRAVAKVYQTQNPTLIRIITADANVGMHANHRRLIEAARGKYIAYCEGDDYWNRADKLSLQVGLLEGNPSVGAVHSDYSHIACVRGRWRARRHMHAATHAVIPQGYVFHDLLRGNFVSTGTVLMRTSVARDYLNEPWPVETYPVGDWPLWIYMSPRWKIAYLEEDLATYRLTPGSLTNQGPHAEIRTNRALLPMISDLCRHFDVCRDLELEAQAVLVRHILYTALRFGDVANAQWAYAWLQRQAPAALTGLERIKCRRLLQSRSLRNSYGVLAMWKHRLTMRLRYRTPPSDPRSMRQETVSNGSR